MSTKIEWTRNPDGSQGKSWNPIRARRKSTGKLGHYCQKISPGCAHCYAAAMNMRCSPDGLLGIGNGVPYAVDKLDQVEMFLDEKTLLAPLKWKKPTRIFVESMSDLFGSWVSNLWLDRIYAVMAICPQHTFIVLTKRPERRLEYASNCGFRQEMVGIEAEAISGLNRYGGDSFAYRWPFPLPNVWEGATIVNQDEADRLVPIVLQTTAAVRWVSYEPALGPIDLLHLHYDSMVEIDSLNGTHGVIRPHQGKSAKLDWIVCGGESGPGARPCNVEWLRSIVQQCKAAGVPCFVKQLGRKPYDPSHGDEGSAMLLNNRKGADPAEWPGNLQVREFPEVSLGE